jgi:hypothetical protein
MKKIINGMLIGFGVLAGTVTVGLLVSFGIFMWTYDDVYRKVTDGITPEAQRRLKADPELILARRNQFIEQYRQLQADDYATLRQKAMDGNPIAQRRLYEIYGRCLDVRRSTTLPLLTQMATINPKMANALREIVADHDRFCGPTTGGREASGKARAFWMRQSAQRGDLVSQMRVMAGEAKAQIPPEQIDDLIKRAAVLGDPAAVMEIGAMLPLMKRPWPDRDTAAAIEDEHAGHAWVMVGCRLGMDCKQGSDLMTNICLRTMSCLQPNYQAYIYTDGVPAAKVPQIERSVAIIYQVLLNPKRAQ